MARNHKPFTLIRRTDSKSFRLTLNPSCGLPARVCKEWYRCSFSLSSCRNRENSLAVACRHRISTRDRKEKSMASVSLR
jgi:hypothetical protein